MCGAFGSNLVTIVDDARYDDIMPHLPLTAPHLLNSFHVTHTLHTGLALSLLSPLLSLLRSNSMTWDTMFEDALSALKKRDDEQAIQHMTEAIQELKRTHLLAILDARAVAYIRGSKYELAFEDAKEMMQQAPKEEAGYLRAAKVYEAQSRFVDAVGMYELGLFHISDSERLKERKLMVEEELQRRVDWVSLLPVDVIAFIMDQLSIHDCRECTQVSRQWRDKLSSCMYIKNRHVQLDDYGRAAPFLGRHVQSLELKHHQDNRMMNLVNVCSNLKVLGKKLILYWEERKLKD